MSIRNLSTPKIRLNVPAGRNPMYMEMDRFFEFSFWMAEELVDLEAEFDDWKTPASCSSVAYDANGLPEDLSIDFESC